MRNYLRYFPIISILFLSCSTSKKISTELKTVSNLDSVTVHRFDSSRVIKEQINDSREITIEYEPSETDTGTVLYGIAGIQGLNLPTKGLRRVNISHSRNTAKTDSVKVIDNSFAGKHSEIKEDSKTETEKKNEVEVPSLGFNIWYVIAGILLPAIAALIFFWIKKRRKKNEFKVKRDYGKKG